MLKPGTKIKIKSWKEIEATLDKAKECRGSYFDPEMTKFCGFTLTVKCWYKREDYVTVDESKWSFIPEWFDVIPQDFWNDGSIEQKSLCLALFRQAQSGNYPSIDNLKSKADREFPNSSKGFNYYDYMDDDWSNCIAHNLPDYKWLNLNPRVLEKILIIVKNHLRYNEFQVLEQFPNNPVEWINWSGIFSDTEYSEFTEFIQNYTENETISYENQLQRKKSDLVRGTVPEGNIICGRKRKATVSIGYLSNKICSGI